MKRRKELHMAKILKMNDGKKYKVIDENGKYYVCEKTQFSKSNPNIVSVEEVEEKDKSKKKTTAKKSPKEKKGE
jgi:16S rRNA U1498 N3-methylase RsmE